MTVEDIRKHLALCTPGPWRWSGNMDVSDPILVSTASGRPYVMSDVRVERTLDDPLIKGLDSSDFNGSEDALHDVQQDFLFDIDGSPKSDQRMAFQVDGRMIAARRLAVYEVARGATRRSDPAVYRADIVDLRSPDASLIAAAPGYIKFLLDEIDALKLQNESARTQ